MNVKKDKRQYESFSEFFSDIGYLMKHVGTVFSVVIGKGISHAFRERIMLVVTAANQCRYCAHFHGMLARKSGMSGDEISMLLGGVIDDCPENEVLALGYAQQWAENNGAVDPQILERVKNFYGENITGSINMTMRMIRIGNLLGNHADALMQYVIRGVTKNRNDS